MARYYWNNKYYTKSAIEMCYSESLNVMLAHSHQKIELMYFYQTSECIYLCGGKVLSFKSRELAVVNPYEIHSCNNWGENCKALCIMVDLKKLNIPSLNSIYFMNKIPSNQRITDTFENIKDVLFNANINELEKECQINSLVYSLIGEISKHSFSKVKSNRPSDKLVNVFKFVENNLSFDIRISDLAELLHLSTDRFYHIFKDATGISPTEYITARRIDKACEYLENTDMLISEIAQQCNFCTSSYFTEKFKAVTEITPKEYRNQYK